MNEQGLRLGQTPWQMARHSARVAAARDFILNAAASIDDPLLRAHVCAMLLAAGGSDSRLEAAVQGQEAASGILLLSSLTAVTEQTAAQKVSLAKLAAEMPYDPTWAAPGAALSSHHCYPGGWALHTALNLQAACHLMEQAERIKGVECNRDAVMAGIILHDWAKLKLLVWNADHDLDADQGGGHHVIMLAECMLRQLAPSVIRLAAGVHGGWWLQPEGVRGSIEKAAQWVNVDVVTEVYPDFDGDDLSVESWIVRQAELCWYAVTRQSVQMLEDYLVNWHAQAGIPCEYAPWRHALYAAFDELQLVQDLSHGNAERLELRLKQWTKKMVDFC